MDQQCNSRHAVQSMAKEIGRGLKGEPGTEDTILHLAASMGEIEAAEVALQNGADPLQKNNLKRTPLHCAASKGHASICLLLADWVDIASRTDWINQWDKNGNTALHLAAEKDSVDCVETLLKIGANHNIPNRWRNMSFVLSAALKCSRKVIDFSLQNYPGIINCADSNGRGILHYLADCDDHDFAVDILQNSCLLSILHPDELNRKDEFGRTPLHSFALKRTRNIYFHDSQALAWILYDRGATLDTRDLNNKSPLYYALKRMENDQKIELLKLIYDRRQNKGVRTSSNKITNLSTSLSTLFKNSEPLLGDFTAWIKYNLVNDYNKVIENFRNDDWVSELYTIQTIDCGNGMWNYFCIDFDKDDPVNEEILEFVELNTIFVKKNHKFPFQFRSLTMKPAVWGVLSGNLDLILPLLELENMELVPTALFCTLLLQKYCITQDIDSDLQEMIRKKKTQIEYLVSRILSNSFARNKTATTRYLLTPMQGYEEFCDISCVQLALYAECMKVLTDPSNYCRDIWWQAWQKELSVYKEKKSKYKVFLATIIGLICPPMLPFCLKMCFPKMIKIGKRSDEEAESSIKEEIEFENYQRPTSYLSNAWEKVSLVDFEIPKFSKFKKNVTKSKNISSTPMSFKIYTNLMKKFYTIPKIKFFYHTTSHFLHLFFFSTWMLYFYGPRASIAEVVTHVYTLGFIFEEGKQLAGKGKMYFSSMWNILDMTTILSYLLAVGFRLVPHSGEINETDYDIRFLACGRFFFTASLFTWWMRIIYIAACSRRLGPAIQMIREMLITDLIPFLFILLVFILGFGIAVQSIMFSHNGREHDGQFSINNTLEVLAKVFNRPFYSMFGDFNLKEMTDVCDNESVCPDALGRFVAPYILMPAYGIIVSILLLNLLIALFANTVSKISEKSIHLWYTNQYHMIEEYDTRSPLGVPLNIIWIIFYDVIYQNIRSLKKTELRTRRLVAELSVLEFAVIQEPWSCTSIVIDNKKLKNV